MKINVTRHHISNGSRGSCVGCPIALAVLEATGEREVLVTSTSVMIGSVEHRLPTSAYAFMSDFDQEHQNVEPFSFDLHPYRWRAASPGDSRSDA